MRFILNWLLISIAISIAAYIVPGIEPFGQADPWLCFAVVGLFLGLVNALVKPLLTIVSLPVTILTLGVFQLVINGLMLELASWFSLNLLGAGIAIDGFWAAFFGAIVISIVGGILNMVTQDAQA